MNRRRKLVVALGAAVALAGAARAPAWLPELIGLAGSARQQRFCDKADDPVRSAFA